MNTFHGAPVVVGVDGSDGALRAVRLAVDEAIRHRRSLRVVHAFIWPVLHVPVGPPAGAPPHAGLRHAAERVITQAVEVARAAAPNLPVSATIVDGQAAPVMVGQARQAALIVLGDRGLGNVTAVLAGSVAVEVSTYARCPVLVDRGREAASGPVVVGVDGSDLSEQALSFALEEAALRESELIAVHAFRRPVSTGPGDMLPTVHDPDQLRDEEERVFAESLAGWQTRYPQVRITRRLISGRAAQVLIEESDRAGLVVVGTLGRSSLTGLIFGSVSQELLHHSNCPVALVRGPREKPKHGTGVLPGGAPDA